MPDGEFFTGPIEDSVEGEVTFHLPAVIARPRGLRGQAALRGGQGGRRQRRARRGVPDQAARHRRRRPPPRRARDRHQLRDRPRHPRGAAGREDRRHRAHGASAAPTPRPAGSTSPRSTRTWSATCARAAAIEVDGEELQEDGKFASRDVNQSAAAFGGLTCIVPLHFVSRLYWFGSGEPASDEEPDPHRDDRPARPRRRSRSPARSGCACGAVAVAHALQPGGADRRPRCWFR